MDVVEFIVDYQNGYDIYIYLTTNIKIQSQSRDPQEAVRKMKNIQAEGPACADPGARTPIGLSEN